MGLLVSLRLVCKWKKAFKTTICCFTIILELNVLERPHPLLVKIMFFVHVVGGLGTQHRRNEFLFIAN